MTKTVSFPFGGADDRQGGGTVPAIGLGTWKMGEDRSRRADEVAALRAGLDLGLTLVDTAEMYADGMSEAVVGEAIAGRRDEVTLVTKVLPTNAGRHAAVAACDASLARLRTDRVDLYLLHWRGSVPLAETLEAFERLIAAGKIAAWGVSNFDQDDCEELAHLAGGSALAANQVLYNVARRGIEHDLLPWSRDRAVPVMAYSPIEQGRLRDDPTLAAIGRRHGVSAAVVALAWTIRSAGVIAIPKSASVRRTRDNAAALDLVLTPEDLAEIDLAFPPPKRRVPLEML